MNVFLENTRTGIRLCMISRLEKALLPFEIDLLAARSGSSVGIIASKLSKLLTLNNFQNCTQNNTKLTLLLAFCMFGLPSGADRDILNIPN